MNYEEQVGAEELSVFDYPLPEKVPDRKTRDSLFTDLFHHPKYALQLYKVLHPEETDVTEKDITAVTLRNIFASGFYNDLGMMVGNRLIILVESQTTWNPNMALRCLLYIADTYQRYISKNQIDMFSKSLITLPKPEFYVVYTGPQNGHEDVIRFSAHYGELVASDDNGEAGGNQPAGADLPLQLNVKMLYNSEDGDILKQYIEYCQVFSRQVSQCNGNRMAAVRNTIKICQENQILSEYIREHEPEVQDNMIACLQDEDYIMKIHILNLEREARAEGLQQGLQQGRAESKSEIQAKNKEILEKDALIAQLTAELAAAKQG